jgi:protocatechuate 3,4-dioxygenase, beta subunit
MSLQEFPMRIPPLTVQEEIKISRRAITSSGLASALAIWGQLACLPSAFAQGSKRLRTLSMPAGPNYPYDFAATPSGKMVIGDLAKGAVPITFAGVLINPEGEPLAGGRVEIWQCDALGYYHHDYHSRAAQRDSGFVAYGWQRTDAAGQFAFRTVMVGRCENRAPHFHIAIEHPNHRKVITQLFLPNHKDNAGDYIYPRLSASEKELQTVKLEGSGGSLRALATLVL